jgi:hypothetical protein
MTSYVDEQVEPLASEIANVWSPLAPDPSDTQFTALVMVVESPSWLHAKAFLTWHPALSSEVIRHPSGSGISPLEGTINT